LAMDSTPRQVWPRTLLLDLRNTIPNWGQVYLGARGGATLSENELAEKLGHSYWI